MHVSAQMYNIYNMHKHILALSGGHVMPVAEMRAPVVGGMERVGGRHIMPVAEMTAPAVGGMGGCKPGTERVGSAPLTSVHRLLRNPDFTWWQLL